MSMKFPNANESPREGGVHTDEQMKASAKEAHQFAINGSTRTQRRAESTLDGGKRRHT
jgi:hypothetical protein